jgi:hypothetical protein
VGVRVRGHRAVRGAHPRPRVEQDRLASIQQDAARDAVGRARRAEEAAERRDTALERQIEALIPGLGYGNPGRNPLAVPGAGVGARGVDQPDRGRISRPGRE